MAQWTGKRKSNEHRRSLASLPLTILGNPPNANRPASFPAGRPQTRAGVVTPAGSDMRSIADAMSLVKSKTAIDQPPSMFPVQAVACYGGFCRPGEWLIRAAPKHRLADVTSLDQSIQRRSPIYATSTAS